MPTNKSNKTPDPPRYPEDRPWWEIDLYDPNLRFPGEYDDERDVAEMIRGFDAANEREAAEAQASPDQEQPDHQKNPLPDTESLPEHLDKPPSA